MERNFTGEARGCKTVNLLIPYILSLYCNTLYCHWGRELSRTVSFITEADQVLRHWMSHHEVDGERHCVVWSISCRGVCACAMSEFWVERDDEPRCQWLPVDNSCSVQRQTEAWWNLSPVNSLDLVAAIGWMTIKILDDGVHLLLVESLCNYTARTSVR